MCERYIVINFFSNLTKSSQTIKITVFLKMTGIMAHGDTILPDTGYPDTDGSKAVDYAIQ